MKYLSVPVFLAFVIVFLVGGCSGKQTPLAFVPENSAIAISVHKLGNLDSLKMVVNLIPPKGRPDQLMGIIEQLKLKNLLKDQMAVLVPDRESVLLLIEVQKFFSADQVYEQVKSHFGPSIETYNYKGTELYKAGGKTGFFFTMHKGLFLIATQAYPIEAALDQKRGSNAFPTAEVNSSGKYSVHLNPDMLTTFYSGYLTPSGKDLFRMLGKRFDHLVLNFPENDSLLIEGIAGQPTSNISFETSFTVEQQLRLLEHVPGRVGQVAITPVNTPKTDNDFAAYILPWVDSHYAVIGKAEEAGFEKDMVIFPIRDKEKAEESIAQLSENLSLGQPVNHGMFSVIPIGKTDVWDISETRNSSIDNSYFVRMDDFVIFAKSMSDLSLFLDDILVGNTMVRQQQLLELISSADNESNQLWCSASFFNSTLFRENELSGAMGQFDISILTSRSQKGSGDLEFKLALQQLSDENRFTGQKVWSTHLPTALIKTPFIIKDKIIFQGENNVLYGLNSEDGQIIWELRLSDPIIGQLQSSVFKNQEVLFFNTSNELFGVDLSGNFLPGYPWQLGDTATQSLTLIDFQNNQDYAFLIPCGNRVFGFEMTGEPLAAWGPLEFESPVIFPIQHFQLNQQDFLFTIDSLNQLIVLNKFGEGIFQ
ncbi:MAG: hypothetical protein DWQ02_01885 [Bacteroidetes bacterium]|nr:MAG: hypothetical protein DWQ02_01885 [Bacteroidota bacterium]